MKAVILAAGEGIRLQPITLTRPKHLIRIGGKPILDYVLKAVRAAGTDEVLIVVHYMADLIKQHVGEGQKFGLKVEYADQKETIGTGNAVAVAESFVDGEFLLVYGDLVFTPEATKSVVSCHQKEKPDGTLAVVPVEKPENYGIAELDDQKHLKRIVEKPERREVTSNLANAGIYVLPKTIFDYTRKISNSSRGEWEFTDAIGLMLQEKMTFLACELKRENWFDIGRPWDLLEANTWALQRANHKAEGIIEVGAHLVGPVTVAESARVRSGAYIEGPAFIDDGSDIGPNCYIRPCTSIGKKVRVGNACEIKNSIIMDGTHIGHLAYVGDSIICEKCNLGAGTITANYRFDAKTVKMSVKDQIIDSERKKLGALLADNVKSGINSLFMPGVRIGINSWVGPNVVVERDLPSNTVILLKQSTEKRDLKPQNQNSRKR